MREIIFRGKSLSDNKWCQGSLYKQGGINPKYYIFDSHDRLIIVDPETVGQFTGLTDSKGNKIFEYDIIEVNFAEDSKVKFIVSFIDGAWHISEISGDETLHYLEYYNEESIIFSNIHDSPELLK